MKFPQDFIERVREANNLIDVVGQYVQLRRSGSNHQGLCPFHNEKTPSFSVSEDKQVYHCFGCKASGNVYTFVQNYQGLTFPEAVEYLARRAGLPIPENTGEPATQRDSKTILLRVNQVAMQFYHDELKRLPRTHAVWTYLDKRRLSVEQIDEFKIGFAPDQWTGLADHFTRRRVPLKLAEQLGLIKPRGAGKSGHYDLFRNRLMFPIFSPTGACIGFGGRVIDPADSPKYLNSVDSQVFHKGRVCYGLQHAAKYIRGEDQVIVVEGYMDWLALVRNGVHNVVAPLGTAFTADHARLLKRYTDKVLVMFDGDEAGREAARRSLPVLLAAGIYPRGLILPQGQDPDDFLERQGVTELRTRMAAAPDLFELVAQETWMGHKSSPSGKVQFLDTLAPALAGIEDMRLRSLYTQTLAQIADVETRLVEQSVRKAGIRKDPASPTLQPLTAAPPPTTSPDEPGPGTVTFDLKGVPRAELEILNVMLMSEVYLKEALKTGVGSEFRHPGARGVYERIAQVYGQMPSKVATLSALLAGEVKPAEAITRHLSEPYTKLTEEAAFKLLKDCVKRVKADFLRSKSRALVTEMKTGAGSSREQLEQIMNIQNDRRSLNHES